MGAEGASGNLLWTILLRRTGREDVGTGPDTDLRTCILPPNTNTNTSTNTNTKIRFSGPMDVSPARHLW